MHTTESYTQLPIYTLGLPDSLDSFGEYSVPIEVNDELRDEMMREEMRNEMGDEMRDENDVDSLTVDMYKSYYLQMLEIVGYSQLIEFIKEYELPSFESIFPAETIKYRSDLFSEHQSDGSAHCEEQSSADHSYIDQSFADESSIGQSSVDWSSIDQSSIDWSSVDESSADESSVDQSSADWSSTDQSSTDQSDYPSDHPSDSPLSSQLDSSSEHLPCELFESEKEELDYSELIDDTPSDTASDTVYVFDPVVAYRESARPYLDDPYDVFLELNENDRLPIVGTGELKKKIEAIRKIYEKLCGKLKKLKSRMNSQSNQISALNRVVLRMQFHEDRLSSLVENLSAKVIAYRNTLESNSYDPHAQHIQRLIDDLYNPFNEFNALANQFTSQVARQNGPPDAGFLNKLHSNLERLCTIDLELQSIKFTVKMSLSKRERVIDELRPAIVRDVLDIYNRLMNEQYDFSSPIKGYCQESIARSFYRLLTTIS